MASGASARLARPMWESSSTISVGVRLQPGSEDRRPADVTAAADDYIGPPPAQDPQTVDRLPLTSDQRKRKSCSENLAFETPEVGKVELVAGLRHQFRLQPPAGADE